MITAAGMMLTLSACGTVKVPPGPAASDPTCADVMIAVPPTLLELERTETSSQATAAWGSGDDTIVMRCGVTPPAPSTDMCTTLEDADGVQVDWIVKQEEGEEIVQYTTYGREPAIDLTVPRSVAPDQPSAAALDLGQLITRHIEATARCIGPGDLP